MLNSNKLIKFNMYAENNIILSSTKRRSRLACIFRCENNNACSMMVVRPTDNKVQCENYEILNNYNLTSKDHFGIEVWYKQETFFKIFKGKDEFEMTTPSPCPSPFTLLNTGCYYIMTGGHNWDSALYECENLVLCEDTTYACTLGEFQSINVSNEMS